MPCDFYQQYFAAPAMRIHGGEPWKRYHAKVFIEIIKHQASDGSFLVPDPGDVEKINVSRTDYLTDDDFGKHYRTGLATMILQAYYRQN